MTIHCITNCLNTLYIYIYIYIYNVSVIQSEVDPGLGHVVVVVVCFVPSCGTDSASSAHAHGFDEVRMHPYNHLLHQKGLKHFIYIYKMEV